MRAGLQRLAAVALGLAIVGAAELAARAARPSQVARVEMFALHGADGAAYLDEHTDLLPFVDDLRRLFVRDRELFWRLRPGLSLTAERLALVEGAPSWTLSTDDRGFRAAGEGGEGRLLVALGDSSTFGWGVDDEAPWPRVLSDGGRWRALNLGVPGYSSTQGRVLAEQALPGLSPEAVVVSFGANDGHYTPWSDAEYLAARRSLTGRALYAFSGMALVASLRDAIYELRLSSLLEDHRSGTTAPRVSPGQLANNLRAIGALAPGAALVALDVCARDEYREVMKALAGDGWLLVSYDGDTVDGCHPDPAGHAWIAAEMERALSRG